MIGEINIVIPAFLAGLCILLAHIPLGIEVIRRDIIFIDLTTAQLASMGAFFAGLVFHHHGENFFIIQISALICTISGSLFLMYIEKNHPKIQETIIGCIFVLSSTLIMLALSQNPHGGEHIKDLLAGQLLFVTYTQIAVSALIILAIYGIVIKLGSHIFNKYFYIIFAVIVTITAQLAGVYLVFATLIFPAVGVYYIKDYRKKVYMCCLGGISGIILGLAGALYFDLSAGPAVVWGIASVMFISFMKKTSYG